MDIKSHTSEWTIETRNKKEMWTLLVVKLEMTVYIGTFQVFILKNV
jgi:hypothetical protein